MNDMPGDESPAEAADLYILPLDEFTAARDALANDSKQRVIPMRRSE